MANRFENIPQSPKLYQEQSMYVPHEFIGTEMPKTPLLAPLDLYTKDIAQRREDANKLADDNSKFTLDHFKDYGTDKINVYGTEENFGGKQRVKAENDKYIAEANNILNNAKYDPEGAKKAIYNLKANYLQNPIINQEKINDENIKALNKILAENQNDPNIQNSPVYQELLSGLRTNKVGVASALPKNEISERMQSLKGSTDYSKWESEIFADEKKYGTTYVQGAGGKSVDADRMQQIFKNTWENDPKLGKQALAEAKAASDYLGYSIDSTNKKFKDNYLTPEQKKLSNKEQNAIISKLISGNKDLLASYQANIGSDKVTGFLDDEKSIELRKNKYSDSYNSAANKAFNEYQGFFGVESSNKISNVNWDGTNKGYGQYQPKPINMAVAELGDKLGFENYLNVDTKELQPGIMESYDDSGKYVGKGENPLSLFGSEIEEVMAQELGPKETKEIKDAFGGDIVKAFAFLQKKGSKGVLDYIISGENDSELTNKFVGQFGDPSVLAKKLNNNLNNYVKNNSSKQLVSFNTEDAVQGTKDQFNQLIQILQTQPKVGKELGVSHILENGVLREPKQEEIDYAIKNGFTNSKNFNVFKKGGKLYMGSTTPYIDPGDSENTPKPKTFAMEIDENGPNSRILQDVILKLSKSERAIDQENAATFLTTAYAKDQEKITNIFSNKGKYLPDRNLVIDNGTKNGIKVNVKYIDNGKGYYVPKINSAVLETEKGFVDYANFGELDATKLMLMTIPDKVLVNTGFK